MAEGEGHCNHNKCSLKPFKIAQNAAHLNEGRQRLQRAKPTINFNDATMQATKLGMGRRTSRGREGRGGEGNCAAQAHKH